MSTFRSFHVERHFADHLHRVGVEEDALLSRIAPILGNRLDDADLVVGAMIEMRIVLSVIAAFRASRLMRPSFCTGRS